MQAEYVGYMFPYLSINRNVCIFGSICIQIILFLGDVEQKQAGRGEAEDGDTAPWAASALASARGPLPAPGFLRMRQGAVLGRSILGGAAPPGHVQSGG